MWGSSVVADIAVRRLERCGHAFPFRHLKYEAAGHIISVPYGPTTVRAVSLSVQGLTDISPVLGPGGSGRPCQYLALSSPTPPLYTVDE